MAKISGFIIGMIIFCLAISIFAVTAVKLNDKYPLTTYSDSDLAVYNNLNKLGNLTEQIDNSSSMESNPGITDILGFYASGGYNTLKESKNSVNTFNNMTQEATEQAELGEMTTYFYSAIISIVLIIVVIVMLIGAIFNRDL